MRSKITESKVGIFNVHGWERVCVLHIAKLFPKWLY